MTCCANPSMVGGDGTPTKLPTGILSGVKPMDLHDCDDCTSDPFPLRRNDRAIVASKDLRASFRALDLGSSNVALLDHMLLQGSAEPAVIRYILKVAKEVVSQGHSNARDRNVAYGLYVHLSLMASYIDASLLAFLGAESSATNLVSPQALEALCPLTAVSYQEPAQAFQQANQLIASQGMLQVIQSTCSKLGCHCLSRTVQRRFLSCHRPYKVRMIAGSSLHLLASWLLSPRPTLCTKLYRAGPARASHVPRSIMRTAYGAMMSISMLARPWLPKLQRESSPTLRARSRPVKPMMRTRAVFVRKIMLGRHPGLDAC